MIFFCVWLIIICTHSSVPYLLYLQIKPRRNLCLILSHLIFMSFLAALFCVFAFFQSYGRPSGSSGLLIPRSRCLTIGRDIFCTGDSGSNCSTLWVANRHNAFESKHQRLRVANGKRLRELLARSTELRNWWETNAKLIICFKCIPAPIPLTHHLFLFLYIVWIIIINLYDYQYISEVSWIIIIRLFHFEHEFVFSCNSCVPVNWFLLF